MLHFKRCFDNVVGAIFYASILPFIYLLDKVFHLGKEWL